MALSRGTREAARRMYVFDRVTGKAIAKKLHLTYSTLARWRVDAAKAGDDWDKARLAASMAGEGAQAMAIKFMEDFMVMLTATVDAVKADKNMKAQERVDALAQLADAYNKAMAGVKRSLPELSQLAVAMEVLQMMVKFVQNRFPQHAKALIEVIEPFGTEVAKHYD